MPGRLPKYREFLHTLTDILDFANNADFAKALGKQQTNISQYLSGAKRVGPNTLASAVRHIGEWDVHTIQEVEPIPQPLSVIPQTPGIYALYDSSASVIYLGQALQLRSEISQTLGRESNFPVRSGPRLSLKKRPRYRDFATYLSAYEVPSQRLRHNLEALLLRVFPNQSHNNKLGSFQ